MKTFLDIFALTMSACVVLSFIGGLLYFSYKEGKHFYMPFLTILLMIVIIFSSHRTMDIIMNWQIEKQIEERKTEK